MGTMDRAENLDRAIDVRDRDEEAETRFRQERVSGYTGGADISLTTVPDIRLDSARGFYARVTKPLIDRVGAFTLLVITAPVCAAITVAIFFTMGKPVLFKQWRVGKGGKPFEELKFRTMRPDRRVGTKPIDVESDRRRTHKHPQDPRMTPLGRFLRKTSLDELPQLINVLRGEMSLIGPRPELVSLVDKYEPWQHARHEVRPGMTGYWQVVARGEQTMQDCLHLDLEYVERMSLKFDLWIAVSTPTAVLGRQKGS